MVSKRNPHRILVPFLIAIGVLAACQGLQSAQPADQLEIVITDHGCSPRKARVEAGESVTVNIENRSETSQTIRLLVYPVEIASNPEREENIYWQVSVQPGFSVIEELNAPKMPGDYDLICGHANNPDLSRGVMTVVRQ